MITTGGIDLKTVLSGSGAISASTLVTTSGTVNKNASATATSGDNGVKSIGSSILEALSDTVLAPPAGGSNQLAMSSLAQSLADLDFTMPSLVQDMASVPSTSKADSTLAGTPSSPSSTTKEATSGISTARPDNGPGNAMDLKGMLTSLSSTDTGQKGLSFSGKALKSYSMASEPAQPPQTGTRLNVSI